MLKVVAITLTALAVFLNPPLVPAQNLPKPNQEFAFEDDLDLRGLKQAVRRSIDYLHTLPPAAPLPLTGEIIPVSRALDTLVLFQDLLNTTNSAQEFQQQLLQNFQLYPAAGLKDSPGTMLVTGYYQPEFSGSLVKEPPYLYPIYSPPPDCLAKKSGTPPKKAIGRLKDGKFLPYWTRQQIDTLGKISGNELLWLEDPVDVFFLHVQGSGIIRLQDGSHLGVHFAGSNGHPYHSVGKYMVKTKRMSLKNASMQTIRRYLDSHPEERDQILFTNPSYVFFNITQTQGAVGNLGQELTAGRSIAADQHFFPAGSLAFLLTREPVIIDQQCTDWRSVHRFVLVQDSGSAIKGEGRVDLFQGRGTKAGLAAGAMKESGKLYFLLKK